MADPDGDHGLVYTDAGILDLDRSLFFDPEFAGDTTVDGYVERVHFLVTETVEAQLGNNRWHQALFPEVTIHPVYAALQRGLFSRSLRSASATATTDVRLMVSTENMVLSSHRNHCLPFLTIDMFVKKDGRLKGAGHIFIQIPDRSFACQENMYAFPAGVAKEETDSMTFPWENPGASYGLNCALAGRGIIVKDKAYYNLKAPELQKFGARKTELLSGITLYMRGNTNGGALAISKTHFSKLLRQVTSHISNTSNVFIQDGAIGSSPKCDVKVRIISDTASGLSPLADILWKTPSRAVSHDSCPLTVYIGSSLSPMIGENLGLGSQSTTTFAAADIERSSLILCGNSFADIDMVKDALSALAAPIVSARGGLPVSARILVTGNSIILLFATEDTIKSSSNLHGEGLVSMSAGTILSSCSVTPFFRSKDLGVPNVFKRPSAVIFALADGTGALPLVSRLTAGQAAYHFLAGYQDGKFRPAFIKGPSPLEPLFLAYALHSQLKNNEISSILINVNDGVKHISDREFIKLVESSLSTDVSKKQSVDNAKVRELKGKYKSFLSGRFEGLPEEFSF